jgi:hypothetical protein
MSNIPHKSGLSKRKKEQKSVKFAKILKLSHECSNILRFMKIFPKKPLDALLFCALWRTFAAHVVYCCHEG